MCTCTPVFLRVHPRPGTRSISRERSATWLTAATRPLWDEMSDAVSDWIHCCRSETAPVCFELQFPRVGMNQPMLSLTWISKQEIWQNSKLLPVFFCYWSCYGGYYGGCKADRFPLSPVQYHYRCDPRVQNSISLLFLLFLFFCWTFFPERNDVKWGQPVWLHLDSFDVTS